MVLFPAGVRDFFSSPKHPDQFWYPPNLQLSRCQFSLSLEHETDHFHLVLGLRMSGPIPLTPTFHGMYRDKLGAGGSVVVKALRY